MKFKLPATFQRINLGLDIFQKCIINRSKVLIDLGGGFGLKIFLGQQDSSVCMGTTHEF